MTAVLEVPAPLADRLAELLDRVYRQHMHRGGEPMMWLEQLVDDCRRVVAAADVVRASAPSALDIGPDASSSVSVTVAATALGIHPRSVARRARRGAIPGAVRVGRDWRIPALYAMTNGGSE